jgi:hypothetical protein
MEISPMPTTTMGYDPALRIISKRDAEKQKKNVANKMETCLPFIQLQCWMKLRKFSIVDGSTPFFNG